MTTFTSSQDGSDIDALIRVTSGNDNYGTYGQLWVGEPNDDANATARSVIKCAEISDPTKIPASALVQSAKLTLMQVEDKANNASTFYVYPVTAAWAENTVTWNNQPGHDATAISSRAFAANEANGAKEFVFDANGIARIQGWINGTYTNYGVKLLSDGIDNQFRFASAEDGTASNRPKWEVVYILGGQSILFFM
jgi:hypothetical protein